MDANATGFVKGLERCFEDLDDPRVQGRCDHSLLDILGISLLAVLCGAEDWPDIEAFGTCRKDWLRTFLKLPNGIPSHDTFRRVFSLLDRKQFAACLFRWTQALHESIGGKVIAVDGKAMRRSFNKKSNLKSLHLVTAWATESGLTLGQIACEEKSNEITALPELLALLNLKGCTVTSDAMGCQTEIARQIRGQHGHYLLAVKDNQPSLADDLHELFEHALSTDFADVKMTLHETHDKGHGRTEHRTYQAIELPADHPQRQKWQDLRTLVIATSCRTVGDGEEQWETRWYITSRGPDAKSLGDAVRRHWSIENAQHWCLDVTFGEDVRRQQDRNGAANLAAVRRQALSMLRQEKTNKRGLKNKRLSCALDPNYLLTVLAACEF